jgi:hypothetical protein
LLELNVEADGDSFLIAEPFETRHQRFLGFEIAGGELVGLIANQFGGQKALHIRPSTADAVQVNYHFEAAAGVPPAWLAEPMLTSWLRPSADLATEIRPLVTEITRQGILRQVIDHTADRFEYGHPEQYFGEGFEAMPALACDLSMGSFVDIHSYAIAALAVFGIEAIYLAGVYCEGDARGSTEPCVPGHCWMESHAGEALDWGVSDVLNCGLALPVPAALNPKPGRRVALESGRGHRFVLPAGDTVDVDRIHNPVVADGPLLGKILPLSAQITWPQTIRPAA